MGGLRVEAGSLTVIQGLPGSGKTSLMKELLVAHANAGATWIAQDPEYQFAEILPPYESARAYRLAARAAGTAAEQTPFRRGAAVAELAGDAVTSLALAIAPGVKAQGRYTVIAYDEAVLAAEPSHCSDVQRDMLARRRHRGLSVLINVQDLGQTHAIWQRLATELYAFRCYDRGRVKAIAERWGKDPDALWDRLSSLGRYEWERIDRPDEPETASNGVQRAARA